MANSKSRESDFMSWLSGKVSPAQLSELYWCYREIDSVFMKGGLLSKPLFETTDIETIRAVQKKIETSKIFRVRNSKNYAKLVAAGRYYLEYSESISEETETADTQPEVGEQADASNTAAERPKEAAKSDAPVQSEKTARPSTTFNRSSFYSYLQIVLKKPAETAKTYCDYISFCELIAQNYNLSSQRLYTSDYDESKATADALVENEEFIQYNNRLKNSLRVAITWLLTFICESEKDVKPSTAVQPEKTEQPATPAQPEKIEQPAMTYQPEKTEQPATPAQSETIESLENITSIEEKLEPEILTIDFRKIREYMSNSEFSYTKPCYLSYFGESKQPCSSWKELYVTFCTALVEDRPQLLRRQNGLYFNGVKLIRKQYADSMRAPKAIPGTDFVLETNFGANDVVWNIYSLLYWCNITKKVVIKYIRKPSAKKHANTENIQPKKTEQSAAPVQPAKIEQPLPKINRSSFWAYLQVVQKMTPETAKTYCDHISFCELIAQNYNLSSQRLYTSDYGEAKATADALLQSKEFGVFNERLNRKPRTALAWLLMFINTGGKSDSVNFTRDVIPENRKKEPVQNYASPTPKSFGTGIHKSFEDTRRKEREAEREKRDAAAKAAAERCEKVLREHFRKGFRINSNIDIKRFRKFYSDMYGEEPKVSNDEIKSIIRRVTVPYDDLYYLPEAMLGEDVREKLLAYIENCFNSGKTIVYFQALCRKFEEDFLDYRVYNDPNALKTYLMLTGCKGFYIVNSGVAKNPNAVADPADELRSCLAEFGRPASFDEIFESLPHLSHDRIRNLIYSRGEFIHNGSSLYLHESLADITEDELEDIAKIIEDAIAEREFISGTELYQAVKAKYPDITENNSVFSIHGFRDMLKYKFGDRFSFKANIISKAGEEISRYDVFADYAKSHAGFTLAELEVMADELDMSIHLDAVYDNSLRISRDNFVAKSQAQFDVEATDNALDRMCVGDYIATGRVTNFGIFPYAGFPWNSFLLEHYVYSYSKKYMLVKNGFSKNRCASAIVKRSAGIESFDDFLVRLLADSDVELKNEPVLRFIVNEGYLTKRSYANIDNIIAKAKTQRQKRDGD